MRVRGPLVVTDAVQFYSNISYSNKIETVDTVMTHMSIEVDMILSFPENYSYLLLRTLSAR